MENRGFFNVDWLLEAPITNFCLSIVTDFIETNASFQYSAGVPSRLVRTAEAGCCEWCTRLQGKYSYPAPREVYQRHENCRCLVEYFPGDGFKQNSHTKIFTDMLSGREAKSKETLLLQRLKRRWQS